MDAFFFTSYARLDNNKHAKLGDAVDELRERVRSKIGAASLEEVGFFDVTDIQTAADWVSQLGEAVAKCRVFVCFCSNTYFNREICGKEFEVFRRRIDQTQPDRRIFPIIWDRCELPQAIQRFNLTNRDFPREYFEDGLCSLRRLRRDAEYEQAIEAVANAIAQAVADPPLPDGAHPVDFDDVTSAFDNPRDGAVRIGALHDQSVMWTVEIGRTLRAVIEQATAPDKLGWRQQRIGNDIAAKLSQGQSVQSLVVVAPDVTMLAPVWRQRLTAIDTALAGPGACTTAMLVGVPPGPPAIAAVAQAARDAAIRTALPLSSRAQNIHGTYVVGSAASLAAELRAAISRVQMMGVKSTDVARVENAPIETAAREAGISLASQPVICAAGSTR